MILKKASAQQNQILFVVTVEKCLLKQPKIHPSFRPVETPEQEPQTPRVRNRKAPAQENREAVRA